jgi:Helix-turn-helix domain
MEARAMSDIEKEKHAAPSDDLLWGARSIADYLGVSIDRVYYLIRTKQLPIAKLGRKTVVASRKKLQRALSDTLTAA